MSDHQNGEVLHHGKTIFTSKGIALDITGISPLLIAKLQSTGVLPDVPTRKVMVDFGMDMEEGAEPVYQTEELSEKDLQDDIEKKQWAEYVAKRDAVLRRRNDNFLKAVFAKGVSIDMSRLEGWEAEMAYLEVEVPDNPLARKVDYIQTEAIANTEDMIEVIIGVLGESGIGEEDLAEIRASFRDTVRRDTPGETIDPDQQVEVESSIYGDESGAMVGSMASQRLLSSE